MSKSVDALGAPAPEAQLCSQNRDFGSRIAALWIMHDTHKPLKNRAGQWRQIQEKAQDYSGFELKPQTPTPKSA
jgi:hypothetical protein